MLNRSVGGCLLNLDSGRKADSCNCMCTTSQNLCMCCTSLADEKLKNADEDVYALMETCALQFSLSKVPHHSQWKSPSYY